MKKNQKLSCEQLATALASTPLQLRRWALEDKIPAEKNTLDCYLFEQNDLPKIAEVIAEHQANPEAERYHVLLVDRDEDALEQARSLVAESDHIKIHTASERHAAQAVVEKHSPDIVIVDSNLPLMGAYSLSDMIKQHQDTHSCVVAIAAEQFDRELLQRSKHAKVDTCIKKPLSQEDFNKICQLAPQPQSLEEKLKETRQQRAQEEEAEQETSDAAASATEDALNDHNDQQKTEATETSDSKDIDTSEAATESVEEHHSIEEEKLAIDSLVIPPPPPIFNEIKAHTEDLVKTGAIIAKDQDLTQKVLQAINSPSFSLQSEVTSINHAVTLLGIDYVKNMVCAELLKRVSDAGDDPAVHQFWESATRTAVIAAHVSSYLGIGCTDESYNLGLFHNCGIPMIFQKYDDYFGVIEKSYANRDGRIQVVEEELIDSNHAEVGFLVSKLWQLPVHLIITIRRHHDLVYIRKLFGKNQQEQKDDRITKIQESMAILKTAEHLSKIYQRLGKQEVNHEWNTLSHMMLNFFDINDDQFLELRMDIENALKR